MIQAGTITINFRPIDQWLKRDWPFTFSYYKSVFENLPETSLGFIFLGYGYWKLGITEKSVSQYRQEFHVVKSICGEKQNLSVLTDFDVSPKVSKS